MGAVRRWADAPRTLIAHFDGEKARRWARQIGGAVRVGSPLFVALRLARDWCPSVVIVGSTVARRENGLDAIPELLELDPKPRIVVAAPRFQRPAMERALLKGACGYVSTVEDDLVVSAALELLSGAPV